MRRLPFRIVLGVAAACLAGCGPTVVTYDVTGTVTYNGKPPGEEGCKITFLTPDGKDATATVAPTGEYVAKGVVAGPNMVGVYYSDPEAAKPRPGGTKAPKSTSPLRHLPLAYADPKASSLKVDVGPGTVFNAELTGPPLK